jgi:hypothetical protein
MAGNCYQLCLLKEISMSNKLPITLLSAALIGLGGIGAVCAQGANQTAPSQDPSIDNHRTA